MMPTPDHGADGLQDWDAVTEHAVRAIVVAPPHRDLDPAPCLDHYCEAILESLQAGQDLWTLLWVEARRDPLSALGEAVAGQRARLLAWTTEWVDGYQREGLVTAARDAEWVAAAVLIALEGLLPVVRTDPLAAPEHYRVVRDQLVDRFVSTPTDPAAGTEQLPLSARQH